MGVEFRPDRTSGFKMLGLSDFPYRSSNPGGESDQWVISPQYTSPQKKHGSPENGGPLEKEIPIGNHHFQFPAVNFFGGVLSHVLK